MLDDQLLAPVATYSPVWTLLGATLLAVAVLLPVGIVLATSAHRGLRLPARRATRVRRACLRRIDRIEADVRAGRLDAPAASSALSQALRGLAADWSGTLYPAMTLAQLDRAGAAEPLRRSVATLYPPTFGRPGSPGTDGDVLAAIADAREVVRTWNRS